MFVLPQTRWRAKQLGFAGFVVTIPFLHAFAPTGWLPLPLIYALLALGFYGASGRAHGVLYIEKSDVLLMGTLVLGVVAFLVRPGEVGQKNVNHTVALAVTIGIFYIWLRTWLRVARVSLEQVGAAAALALLIASSAVITEFLLINTVGTYLADLIPYAADDLSEIALLEAMRRPRGLAAEPGFTAMVFEALTPLAWLYLRTRRVLIAPFALVIVPAFAMLFSAGAVIAIVLALISVLVLRGRSMPAVIALVVTSVAVVTAILISDAASWFLEQIVGRKVLDVLGVQSVIITETASRYEAYTSALAIVLSHPFGIGWGTISEMFSSGLVLPGIPVMNSRGALSLYLEVFVSAGYVGGMLFLVFLVGKVLSLRQRNDPQAGAVLFALLMVIFHHGAILEFWFPMLWLLLALSDYLLDSRCAYSGFVQSSPGTAEVSK